MVTLCYLSQHCTLHTDVSMHAAALIIAPQHKLLSDDSVCGHTHISKICCSSCYGSYSTDLLLVCLLYYEVVITKLHWE